MNPILGIDIAQVEHTNNCVIVHMKNGDTIEWYSDVGLQFHHYTADDDE